MPGDTVTNIPLSELTNVGGTQWRVKNSSKAIEDYAEHLRGGGKLPPIDVFVDAHRKKHVGDGNHRIGAYRLAGETEIPARLHKGDADAAYLFGVRAGVQNKCVRIRREDIRKAALGLMTRPGIMMSDRQIATELNLPHNTISRWHRELASTVPMAQSQRVKGADGRVINTANIGKRATPQPLGLRLPHACDHCSERFANPVWHCLHCGHHYHELDDECGNCHAAKPELPDDELDESEDRSHASMEPLPGGDITARVFVVSCLADVSVFLDKIKKNLPGLLALREPIDISTRDDLFTHLVLFADEIRGHISPQENTNLRVVR